MASPMPEAPPATTATLPSKRPEPLLMPLSSSSRSTSLHPRRVQEHLIVGVGAPQHLECLWQLSKADDPRDHCRCSRQDGSRWWGLFAAKRLGDEVVEFVLDVTDRKEAEAALRASEERFRALVAATASAVWTTDAQGLVCEDSPSWRAFTGQTPEQWLGTGWADAVHPDDRSRAAGEWASAVATAEPFDTEFRLRHVSGEWRLVAARGVPVRGPDGTVREWVGTTTDITARRRAEEARRAIEERYHLAVRATNDAF